MNWFRRYIYAQGLAPYLQQLGVRPEVQQFITSLPGDKAQHFVNFVRSNPKIDLPSLQTQVQLPQKKEAEYFPEERAIASRFYINREGVPQNTIIGKWILVNLRKARKGRQDLTYQEIHSKNIFPEYNQFILMLADWDNANELMDFLDNNPNFRLDSYTPNQVYNIVEEWHRSQAGKGEGKIYGPLDQSLIVYGPQWKNKEWQGWTIQEVRTKNDLAVEGNLKNDCVGSYFDKVEKGRCRILSLRDPQNKPHVTIETDNSIHDFRQILGNSNKEPDKSYKAMIKEWITSLPGERCFESKKNRELLYHDIEKTNNALAKILEDVPEYLPEYGLNLKYNIDVGNFERIIEDYLGDNHHSDSEGDYRGAIKEFPRLFIEALLTEEGVNIISDFKDALSSYEKFVKPRQKNKKMEDRSKWLPWAAIDDAFRYINKLREKKVIP